MSLAKFERRKTIADRQLHTLTNQAKKEFQQHGDCTELTRIRLLDAVHTIGVREEQLQKAAHTISRGLHPLEDLVVFRRSHGSWKARQIPKFKIHY